MFVLYALFTSAIMFYYFNDLVDISVMEKSLVMSESVKAGLTAHMKNMTMDKVNYFVNEIEHMKGIRRIWINRVDDIGIGQVISLEKDSVERKVLKTKQPQFIKRNVNDTEEYRVSVPYIATNSGSLKCLECHKVPEGTVLGILNIEVDVTKFMVSNFKMLYLTLFVFILFVVLSSLLLIIALKKGIARPLKILIDKFSAYIKEYRTIEESEFALIEFQHMTKKMNEIIIEIKERDEDIQRINAFLESKVNERTREIEKMATTDELTGLYNRNKLNKHLQDGKDANNAVLLVNVDDFSQINNVYGMRIGDLLLKEVGNVIETVTAKHIKRGRANCYRFSADEFVIVILNPSETEAVELATVLKEYVNKNHLSIVEERLDFKISFTIGIAYGRDETIVRLANIAFVEAREFGKNRIQVYNPNASVENRYANNIHWANVLKKAIEDDNLIPYFQPIVNNKSAKIEKFECLVRMIDGNGEVISPARFLEPAKRTGTATVITKIMIEKSFAYFKDKPFEFSINITDSDFKEGLLSQYLISKAKEYGVPHNQVVIEMLESISMRGNSYAVEQVNELCNLGFKIAIDDFGADYSNFSRLLELKVDYIKIDGLFIKNIHKDPNSFKIVKSIKDFSDSVNAKVIAEFVHSREVQDKVVELGIEYSQGYFFSPPVIDIWEVVNNFDIKLLQH